MESKTFSFHNRCMIGASRDHLMLNLFSTLTWKSLDKKLNMEKMRKNQFYWLSGLKCLWVNTLKISSFRFVITIQCLMFTIAKMRMKLKNLLTINKCQKNWFIFIYSILNLKSLFRIKKILFLKALKLIKGTWKNIKALFSIFRNLVKS